MRDPWTVSGWYWFCDWCDTSGGGYSTEEAARGAAAEHADANGCPLDLDPPDPLPAGL